MRDAAEDGLPSLWNSALSTDLILTFQRVFARAEYEGKRPVMRSSNGVTRARDIVVEETKFTCLAPFSN
jgi:hypothetical protein